MALLAGLKGVQILGGGAAEGGSASARLASLAVVPAARAGAAGALRAPGGGGGAPAVPPPAARGSPAPAPAPAAAECEASASAAPGVSPQQLAAERALLEGLRARRTELDQREQAIAGRELMLSAAERRIGQRVEELSALQQRLEALQRAGGEREEQGWRQMVRLYEGMRPRDAAAIFDELEMPVPVEILGRMGERRAAPVLGAMRPERARLATAELARHRAAPARPGGE